MDGFVSKIQKQKMIFHMDGDAFFVGVEVAKNPQLRGLPVVTGEERGIVSALSYEAKALGVVRGLPIFRVKKNFPQVIVLPGDYKSYVKYSGMMFDIVRRYADDVEEYSIDECFADLTGLEPPLKMTYRQIAERIKKEIRTELDISVSIGLAPTKVLAKVASKWVKPDGLTCMDQGTAPEFLTTVPISKVWGIGRQTSQFLKKRGIQTAHDFVAKNFDWVKDNLAFPYQVIWQELRGVSIMEIDPNQKTVYSSVQKTRSFHPATKDTIFLLSQLSKHIEDACAKARHYNLAPRKASIFLKTRDFQYITTDVPIFSPTNAPEIIITQARQQFSKIYTDKVLYRTTGVTLYELIPTQATQTDLFGNTSQADKFEAIHKQIDSLEAKFGKRMIYLASTHHALKRKVKGTDADDLDRDLLFL